MHHNYRLAERARRVDKRIFDKEERQKAREREAGDKEVHAALTHVFLLNHGCCVV